MRRILVTGNSGSGKTSLSLKLGETLGLPVIHLDKVVWAPGWRKVPRAQVANAMNALVQEPRWIIDGVSPQACQAADTIIFLDFGVSVCLTRALRRTIRHLFVQRPEAPENCPEALVLMKMIRIIFNFPKKTRPTILLSLKAPNKNVIHIRYNSEVRELIGRLRNNRNEGNSDSISVIRTVGNTQNPFGNE